MFYKLKTAAHRKIFFISTIILSLLLSACNLDERRIQMKGKFVYSDGSDEIYLLDLEHPERESETIYRAENHRNISGIFKYGEKEIIFEEEEITVEGEYSIKKLNIKTGEVRKIVDACLLAYFVDTKRLYFYRRHNKGAFIKVSPHNNELEWMVVSDEPGVKNKIYPVPANMMESKKKGGRLFRRATVISPDEFVYKGEDNKFWKYNITKTESAQLADITDCELYYTYIPNQKSIVCTTHDDRSKLYSRKAFIFDLTTGGKKEIPAIARGLIFNYIEEYDLLIYYIPFIYTGDLYIYSFKDNISKKIKKRIIFSYGVFLKTDSG